MFTVFVRFGRFWVPLARARSEHGSFDDLTAHVRKPINVWGLDPMHQVPRAICLNGRADCAKVGGTALHPELPVNVCTVVLRRVRTCVLRGFVLRY